MTPDRSEMCWPEDITNYIYRRVESSDAEEPANCAGHLFARVQSLACFVVKRFATDAHASAPAAGVCKHARVQNPIGR